MKFFSFAIVKISSTFYQYRSHVQSSLHGIFHKIQIKIHKAAIHRLLLREGQKNNCSSVHKRSE